MANKNTPVEDMIDYFDWENTEESAGFEPLPDGTRVLCTIKTDVKNCGLAFGNASGIAFAKFALVISAPDNLVGRYAAFDNMHFASASGDPEKTKTIRGMSMRTLHAIFGDDYRDDVLKNMPRASLEDGVAYIVDVLHDQQVVVTLKYTPESHDEVTGRTFAAKNEVRKYEHVEQWELGDSGLEEDELPF